MRLSAISFFLFPLNNKKRRRFFSLNMTVDFVHSLYECTMTHLKRHKKKTKIRNKSVTHPPIVSTVSTKRITSNDPVKILKKQWIRILFRNSQNQNYKSNNKFTIIFFHTQKWKSQKFFVLTRIHGEKGFQLLVSEKPSH